MRKTLVGTDGILINDSNSTLLAGTVDNPSAVADSDGQKYLKSGTLLTSDKDFSLTNDGSAVLTPTTNATKAQGVLLHDTNVIEGPQSASVITAGTINRARMDSDIAAVYTNDLINALKPVLSNVKVIDRD